MRNFWMWLVCNVPLGPLAPTVMGWLLGSKPKKIHRR